MSGSWGKPVWLHARQVSAPRGGCLDHNVFERRRSSFKHRGQAKPRNSVSDGSLLSHPALENARACGVNGLDAASGLVRSRERARVLASPSRPLILGRTRCEGPKRHDASSSEEDSARWRSIQFSAADDWMPSARAISQESSFRALLKISRSPGESCGLLPRARRSRSR